MNDANDPLGPKERRRAAIRLAFVATITAILWSVAANMLQKAVEAGLATISTCSGAECTDSWFAEGGPALLLCLLLAAAGFVVAVIWGIPAVQGAFFLKSAAIVKRDKEAPAHRALIMALSNLDHETDVEIARNLIARAGALASDAARRALLDEICEPAGPHSAWRWQQPLRLVRHHWNRLELISLVLSRESAAQYANLFLPLLTALKPERARIVPDATAAGVQGATVDHNNYNDVMAALDRACELALKATNNTPGEICIDITSGTRAYAVAAAVRTLNSGAVFSYVETHPSPNVGQVVVYNASIKA